MAPSQLRAFVAGLQRWPSSSVDAYAAGKIELEKPGPDASKNQLRHAPSFMMGDVPASTPERPYTAVSVAKFIGWMESATEPQRKVVDALAALAFVEEAASPRPSSRI